MLLLRRIFLGYCFSAYHRLLQYDWHIHKCLGLDPFCFWFLFACSFVCVSHCHDIPWIASNSLNQFASQSYQEAINGQCHSSYDLTWINQSLPESKSIVTCTKHRLQKHRSCVCTDHSFITGAQQFLLYTLKTSGILEEEEEEEIQTNLAIHKSDKTKNGVQKKNQKKRQQHSFWGNTAEGTKKPQGMKSFHWRIAVKSLTRSQIRQKWLNIFSNSARPCNLQISAHVPFTHRFLKFYSTLDVPASSLVIMEHT